MTVRTVCLDAADAVELTELLDFVSGWLVWDSGPVSESLRKFCDGFSVGELRADLARFVFLLEGDDGELLLGVER